MTDPGEHPAFPQLPDRRRRLVLRSLGLAVVLLAGALVLGGVFGGRATVPLGLSLTVLVGAAVIGAALALVYSARSRRFRDAVLARSGADLAFVSVASAEWAAAIARLPEAGTFARPFGVAVGDDGIGLWREGESEPALLVPWAELVSAHPGTATPVVDLRDGGQAERRAGEPMSALWLRWRRPDGVVELPITAPRSVEAAERLLDEVARRVPVV